MNSLRSEMKFHFPERISFAFVRYLGYSSLFKITFRLDWASLSHHQVSIINHRPQSTRGLLWGWLLILKNDIFATDVKVEVLLALPNFLQASLIRLPFLASPKYCFLNLLPSSHSHQIQSS